MTETSPRRGGAPVGYLSELKDIEASAVLYLRLWCEGPNTQEQVWNDIAGSFGPNHGQAVLEGFEDLCNLIIENGRRPIMHHQVTCKCLGSDKAAFANFIFAAADGDREDAMLIAALLVRSDMAQPLTALAEQFGLALRRMSRVEIFGAKHQHIGLGKLH